MTSPVPDEVREWPPVYDAATLDDTIKRARVSIGKEFYLSQAFDQEPAQGDIIELSADVPVIDANGDPAAVGTSRYWMVVANSCDIARMGDSPRVLWAPIAPMVSINELGFDTAEMDGLRAYKTGREFLLPAWGDHVEPHVADLTRCVTIHRDALRNRAPIRARLVRSSWILLNACLVRFLARADRRYL